MKRVGQLTFAEATALILSVSTILAVYLEKVLSLQIIVVLNSVFSAAFLLAIIWALFIRRKTSIFLILIFLFFISLIYASYRNIDPPLPHNKKVSVRLRMVSEPGIRKKSLQYTARVLELEKAKIVPHHRVVFNVGFPEEELRRGFVVDADGLFVGLPFEKARGYAWWLRSRGIKALFEGYSREVKVVKRPTKYSPISISNRLKLYVRKVNERLLFFPHSEFATALLTGKRDNIPPVVMESFKKSGTLHILAVSGLHVGFISLFLFIILRLFRIPQVIIYIVVACVIVFYMLFIGEAPSVRRASAMFLCGIVVFAFDRDRDYINILAIAFTILWILNPLSVMNPGFLLSFTATFGIIFLLPHFSLLMKKVRPKFVSSSLAATLGVQIYILPVMLCFFGSFPYINVIANLPIVLLTGLALALEILSLILYSVFLPLAVLVSEVNMVVITAILRIAALCARAPPLTAARFPPVMIPVYLTGITAFFIFLFRRIEKVRAYE